MNDKSLWLSAIAGIFAGIMQLSTIGVLSLKMQPSQIAGALFISVMFGFGVAQGAQTWFHLEPFFAGTIGTLSGALPAVFVPLLVTKKIMRQLGVEANDLTQLGSLVKEELK